MPAASGCAWATTTRSTRWRWLRRRRQKRLRPVRGAVVRQRHPCPGMRRGRQALSTTRSGTTVASELKRPPTQVLSGFKWFWSDWLAFLCVCL
jgi:hypothetical protein